MSIIKKCFAAFIACIFLTGSSVDAAARVIERGSAAQVSKQQLKDGDEVELPSMDIPPMTIDPPPKPPKKEEKPFDWTEWADPDKRPKPEQSTEQPSDDQQSKQPQDDQSDNQPKTDLPDYTIPGVETEQSKPPTPEPPAVVEDEGLEFKVVHRNGVMAFALIAAHEKYELRPALARGIIPGRATVKGMSSGTTAAINASYFGLSGEIYGVTKIDGVIVGTTYFTRSAMGINEDGTTMFGRVDYQGTLTSGGMSVDISGVNCERGENSIVVYNNFQGRTTGTNDFGSEAVVERGIVKLVTIGKGNNVIPAGGYVISAHGSKKDFIQKLRAGDQVEFSEAIVDVDGGGDFNSALQVIGAGPRLVKDGRVFVNADQEKFPPDIRIGRAPRSAVGVTKYGDYIFAVVDGRQTHSRGCTLQEWATILLNDFGAVNAINLDGGGSTELVVKGNIVNSPSDGKERPVADALLIVGKSIPNS